MLFYFAGRIVFIVKVKYIEKKTSKDILFIIFSTFGKIHIQLDLKNRYEIAYIRKCIYMK